MKNLLLKTGLFKIDPRLIYLLLTLCALAAAAAAPGGPDGYTMP